ncbi:MAG: hypothetical protein AB7V28_04995 [Arcobacteraceae bacterium]|jgi:hypothetical protein
MNLPHLPPILFAQKALEITPKTAKVSLLFPFLPTLGMFVEAAAQSSSVFAVNASQKGFIVSLKEIQLLKKSTQLEMTAYLTIETRVGEFMEISFTITTYDKQEIFAMGKIILNIRE